MILIIHIIFAIIGAFWAIYSVIFPSKIKLLTTALLTIGAIVSGAIISFTNPTHITKDCIQGIIYLGFITGMGLMAHKRLTLKMKTV